MDEELPKKPYVQSCITKFSKNMLIKWLNVLKNQSLFFQKSNTYPNSDIFVKAKRLSLFWYVSLFVVPLKFNFSTIEKTF